MDAGEVLTWIIVALIVIVVGVIVVAAGAVLIVLVLYMSAYTVALLHILFVEPMIFDTHSLFTIPYNEIYAMSQMYQIVYWIVAFIYMLGISEGIFGKYSE